MAEKTTIARPYAQAAFDVAQKSGSLKAWSEMLLFCAVVAADERMAQIIGNTSVQAHTVAQLLLDIGAKRIDAAGANFVKLLAHNRRLTVLPEIAAQFEILRADAEKTIEAEVVSAFEVTADQQKKIAERLKARLGRAVTLSCKVDTNLLGGVVIKAGDLVIDGSAIGKLDKLSVGLAR